MAILSIDIVTEAGILFQDKAEFVVAPGEEGELGILPGHAPLVSTLKPGLLRVQKDKREIVFDVQNGFIEVHADHIQILSGSVQKREPQSETR